MVSVSSKGVRVEGSRRQLTLAVAGSGSQPAQKRLTGLTPWIPTRTHTQNIATSNYLGGRGGSTSDFPVNLPLGKLRSCPVRRSQEPGPINLRAGAQNDLPCFSRFPFESMFSSARNGTSHFRATSLPIPALEKAETCSLPLS